jgi:hypothetical protein
MILFRKKIFSLLMICAFCFSGCTNSSEYYVQGLVNLSSQENNKAIKNFEKAIKKGSSLEVLLSLKELKKLILASNILSCMSTRTILFMMFLIVRYCLGRLLRKDVEKSMFLIK